MKSVSVVIPVRKINEFIIRSVPKILNLNWSDLEIIILVDKKDEKFHWTKTRVIATNAIGPAKKRDLAIKYAKNEILAFLDDDAYPDKNWLKRAMKYFSNTKVAAVGGPAITPQNSSLIQKVSGSVFESFLGGGLARNRYLSIGNSKTIEDWPTVNLLIRKDIFKKIGGFDTHFWPGEDTKLCLDIINAGYKIIYEPKAIVFHHRRSSILLHLKQAGSYGLHRGYFAKEYPKTSFKLWYFMPTFFVLYLLSFLIKLNSPNLNFFRSLPLILYLLGLIVDMYLITKRWKNIFIGLFTGVLIMLTHVWYGIRFAQGLLITSLRN